MIGKSGIERQFDDVLRGQAGGRLMRVDVEGFHREDIANELPKPGSDVQLAIDVTIQQAVEEELQDTVGSAVIVDPRNGDILAMASSPSFDPNMIVPFITTESWNVILQNPDHPLLNRAIQGSYTPGSIVKPIVALAGLENGKLDPGHVVHCPGYFMLGSQRYLQSFDWPRPDYGNPVTDGAGDGSDRQWRHLIQTTPGAGHPRARRSNV